MKDYKPDTKRIRKRVLSKLDVSCRQIIAGKNAEFWCVSTDVSEFGVQVSTVCSMDTAKSVFLQINLPYPKNAVVTAIGRVRWRKESGPGKSGAPAYAYGISFEEIDPKSREALFHYLFPREAAEEAQKEKP